MMRRMMILKKKNSKPNVFLLDDNITINRMNHPSCVTSFIRCVNLAIKRGKRKLNIICKCEKDTIFPDACLPISALIQNYKKLYDVEFNVIIADNKYLKRCSFENPLDLEVKELKECKYPLDKIFSYSSEEGHQGQVAEIVQAYINYISKVTMCEDGVLEGLIWCINEVMDNVLVHSQETTGYIMAQYHSKKKILAICVYDCGIGIYNSLLQGKHKPASEIDSLTMAVQEGVGDGQGQGNGLYGLFQIVNDNNGRLTISSGHSAIMLRDGDLTKFSDIVTVSEEHLGTIVDFQLDLSKRIDIKKALKSIGGFDGFDIRIINMIEDSNWLRYDVYDNCSGTGTRIAGKELRNDVLNTIRRANSPIILDFKNVQACSSSFIDEFVSKLVVELGILEFNKLIKIENMNDFVSHLFERSTVMRMHQEWEDSKKSDN